MVRLVGSHRYYRPPIHPFPPNAFSKFRDLVLNFAWDFVIYRPHLMLQLPLPTALVHRVTPTYFLQKSSSIQLEHSSYVVEEKNDDSSSTASGAQPA